MSNHLRSYPSNRTTEQTEIVKNDLPASHAACISSLELANISNADCPTEKNNALIEHELDLFFHQYRWYSTLWSTCLNFHRERKIDLNTIKCS